MHKVICIQNGFLGGLKVCNASCDRVESTKFFQKDFTTEPSFSKTKAEHISPYTKKVFSIVGFLRKKKSTAVAFQ